MNRLICLITLAGLLSGCGIVKTKKLIQLTDVSSNWETLTKKEQQLLIIRDSTREDMVVEIIPIGNFSYSLKDGFKGSGSAIKITGRKGSNMEVLENTNSNAIYQQAEKKNVIKTTTDKVVKHGGLKFRAVLYGLLALVVCVPLLWIWLKNYRRSRFLE